MKTVHLEMIREFQCPGCVCAPDFDAETPADQVEGCKGFRIPDSDWNRCRGHVLGTAILGAGHIALGLPKGFNKPGDSDRRDRSRNTMDLTFITKDDIEDEFDCFNVPVWAMEKDNHLFVRVLSPRINRGYVAVVKGAKMSDLPKQFKVIDVSEFQDKIE